MKIPNRGSKNSRSGVLLVVGAAVFSFVIMILFLYIVDSDRPPARYDERSARNVGFSPFDPEKVVSLFQMLGDGSLREVIVRDASDQRQIALVQAHLREKAEQYSKGDFSDAARVHAEEMSWVNELTAGAEQIDVLYTDLPNGGQIRFTTANPVLVKTLHQWLTAQVSDWENQTSVR